MWCIGQFHLDTWNKETDNCQLNQRLGMLYPRPDWVHSLGRDALKAKRKWPKYTCIFEAASDATQANLLSVQAYPV